MALLALGAVGEVESDEAAAGDVRLELHEHRVRLQLDKPQILRRNGLQVAELAERVRRRAVVEPFRHEPTRRVNLVTKRELLAL